MAEITYLACIFIKIKEIIYLESDSQNSRFFLTDNRSLLVTKPLRELEELLTKYRFYRVNIPYLINLLAVKRYVHGDGGEVIMQNGENLPVAKRKKDEFLKMIGS